VIFDISQKIKSSLIIEPILGIQQFTERSDVNCMKPLDPADFMGDELIAPHGAGSGAYYLLRTGNNPYYI